MSERTMHTVPSAVHEVPIRVRYCETDAMAVVHHANYFNYLELARTELFRAQGGNYRRMEERGYFLVIVHVECDYKAPAKFDDDIVVRVWIDRRSPAKLEHAYEIVRQGKLLAKARSILACLDKQGQVQPITDEILFGTDLIQPTEPV